MKKMKDVRRAVALGTTLVCVLAGMASAEDWRRLMTQGKLDADLGKHGQAAVAFQAIADDQSAPSALRWEAGVRLGLARSAAGDPAGSAAAFRGVLTSYGEEPDARRFLTRAVAGTVPGKIWPDFRDSFEKLLRTARVVAAEELGPGIRSRKVDLRDGDVELSAVWKTFPPGEPHGFDHRSEVAAYALDKVLELEMVPPTVLRTLEGEEGSLQLWVYGCETLSAVRDHAPGTPEWWHQMSRMRAFDYLINNTRNVRQVLVDPSWQMVLIDHAPGFSVRPKGAVLPDRFDGRMVEGIRQLTRPDLHAILDAVLTEAQVDSLLERRDALLAHVEELITERGKEAVLF
jgi:hypothetical protein